MGAGIRAADEAGLSVISRLSDRSSVWGFLAITFGWSWTVWVVAMAVGYGDTRIVQIVGAWGPLLGAVTVIGADGRAVRTWAIERLRPGTVGYRWYAIAVLVPFALTQTDVVIAGILGHVIEVVEGRDVLVIFAINLLLAGALEEFGWRGFLQEHLQSMRSELTAALAVGFVWGAWHLPLTLAGTGAGYSGGEAVAFLVFLPLVSIPMAWIYNRTGGGLLLVMLFHATMNTTPIVDTADPPPIAGLGQVVVFLGIPLVLVLRHRDGRLTTQGRAISIEPLRRLANRWR